MTNKKHKKPTRTKAPAKAKTLKERIFGKKKVGSSAAEKEQIDSFFSGKTLEIKINDNIRGEIVAKDELDNLLDVIEENNEDKVIVVVPEVMINDLEKVIGKYIASTGLDISAISKHFNSDFFKNILLPYKGIKFTVADREFMAWKENKTIILTIETV